MTARCLKGNRKLGLVKGQVYVIQEMSSKTITIFKGDGRRVRFHIPSCFANRLHETGGFNVNSGDGINKARFTINTGG